METSLATQAVGLGLALAMGVGLGLAYDLLRPPRRRCGPVPAALLDLLYSAFAGTAAFLYAVRAPAGRMGLWELTAVLLGALFYLYALSPVVLPALELPYRVMEKIMRSCKKASKKLEISAKKIFPNVREWIIMRR